MRKKICSISRCCAARSLDARGVLLWRFRRCAGIPPAEHECVIECTSTGPFLSIDANQYSPTSRFRFRVRSCVPVRCEPWLPRARKEGELHELRRNHIGRNGSRIYGVYCVDVSRAQFATGVHPFCFPDVSQSRPTWLRADSRFILRHLDVTPASGNISLRPIICYDVVFRRHWYRCHPNSLPTLIEPCALLPLAMQGHLPPALPIPL
jgi:hypothetical protein